jgi:hypothetical protein
MVSPVSELPARKAARQTGTPTHFTRNGNVFLFKDYFAIAPLAMTARDQRRAVRIS